MNKTDLKISDDQLAHLGGGVLGYVREIESHEARKMLGGEVKLPTSVKLFCLYNADGTPISISHSKEAALGDASQHALIAASVH